MDDLVTLEQAKRDLHLSGSHEDDRLRDKLAEAQAIVIDYLTGTDTVRIATIEAWTDETVPLFVRAAIKQQFAELVRFCGDDVDPPKREHGFLSPTVVALLHRYRRPVFS